MSISEKAAYFKGLVEGLSFGQDTKEGKLWLSLTELITDIVSELNDLDSSSHDFADSLEELRGEVGYIQELTSDFEMPESLPEPEGCEIFTPPALSPELQESPCSGDCADCGICDYDEDDDSGDVISYDDVYTPVKKLEDIANESDGIMPEKDESPWRWRVENTSRFMKEPPKEEEPEIPEEEEVDGVVYDVICPVCGEAISFDEETLKKGFIHCPGCKEKLEFDLTDD